MTMLYAMASRALGSTILGLLMVILPASGYTKTSAITVPVSLDYPLLRHALITQLFNTDDGSRDILDDPSGCNRILLSEPKIGAQQDKLEFVARVKAQLGVSLPGGCQQLLEWHGTVGALSIPQIQPGGKAIKLQPQKIWLLDKAGKNLSSGPLWEAGSPSIKAFLGSYVVDFAPYIKALEDFLPDVLPNRSTQQLQSVVNSLSVGDIKVTAEALNASINMTVPALPVQPAQPAPMLTGEELLKLETQWQMMDALLVGAIKQYASATALQSLRNSLFDILIESRYRLLDALNQPPDSSNDAVRHWFIASWQELSPVVRSIAMEQPDQAPLLWLSALTATDALYALDQLGPGIGLDISTNGLRRLARMINATQPEELLRYSEEIDPELQQLLQEQLESSAPEAPSSRFHFSLFPRAYAATTMEELNRWLATRDNLPDYLPRVSAVLLESTSDVLKKNQLEQSYHELFEKIVLTTAWQESCWRQYIVLENRIEPLRSGTGDVGIMQVNERVWRGFYDLQQLRWDINYNSTAGAEILLNYLVKYALKQGEQQHSGGIANLSRSTYATYNGGPSQVSRYRRSDVAPSHRKVDELFWDKYQQVNAGQEMNVAKCLGGEVPAGTILQAAADKTEEKTVSQPEAPKPAPKPASSGDGTSWLMAQPAQNFTIQMGAFSSREAASNFIRQESLPAPVYVHPVQKDKTRLYLVVHGSFATRSQADPAKSKYQRLQPWLRSFGDLQQ